MTQNASKWTDWPKKPATHHTNTVMQNASKHITINSGSPESDDTNDEGHWPKNVPRKWEFSCSVSVLIVFESPVLGPKKDQGPNWTRTKFGHKLAEIRTSLFGSVLVSHISHWHKTD
ncbi:hypothetical protein BU15DRAFT_64774 [Melanogaster broomeanus]|nr:hypothetical protein BU15DRAFT_64774 [Melanogaster broomeanus]